MTELQQFIKVLEREKNIFKVSKDPDEEGAIVTIFHYNSSNPFQIVCVEFDNDENLVGTIGSCELFDTEEFEELANMFRQCSWYEERYEQYWGRTMEFRYGKPTVEQALEILEEVYGADSVQYHAYESMIEDYYYDGVYAGVNGKDIDNRMLELFYQLMK